MVIIRLFDDVADPSLEQMRVFVAVVETGSFSAAARSLGRAQSAVTYAVQGLEAGAGVTLFDRSAYRPVLSDAGRALLPCVRVMLAAADNFHAVAGGLSAGLEAELTVVVEAMFPMSRLVGALVELQSLYPSVQTRIEVESLDATRRAVLDGRAEMGLVISPDIEPDVLLARPVGEIELVVVAAPGHPLAGFDRDLQPEDLREHLQLVFSERSDGERPDGQRTPDRGVAGRRTWRLADLGAKRSMLLAGLGWGSMPRHIVEDDLANGRLVRLRPAMWDGRRRLPRLPVNVVRRRDRAAGIAGRWLFDRLAAMGGGEVALTDGTD